MPRLAALLASCSLLISISATASDSRAADSAPLHVIADAEVNRALDALEPETGRGPVRLAVSLSVSLSEANGAWTLEASGPVWWLRLYSAGATLLIPSFDVLTLPDGAELRAYNRDGSVVRGPYSAADVADGSGLTLPFIPGEEALLELRMPDGVPREGVQLHIAHLGHGVLPLAGSGLPVPKSSSCNIDVACQQGGAWNEPIRSVVALQIPAFGNSVSLCSGQLVNNTAQNGAPYVLTANHCGITASNARNVVAFFNFQTSSCNASANGNTDQNIVGARLLMSDPRSDVSLLQLDRAPPASFNAWYSGFNASPVGLPSSGASIHHPRGDEKRISLFSQPASRERVRIESIRTTDAFRVRWSQGITEPGSSGGGLWNERRQLVGVLSGGNTSCANPGGEDYYGRLDVAWNNGLSGFLDAGNTQRSDFCGTSTGGRCASGGVSVAPVPSSGSVSNNGSSRSSGGGALDTAPLLLLLWLVREGLRRRSSRCNLDSVA